VKKILVIFLIIVPVVTAFGQFRFDMWGHVEPDLLQFTLPIGDAGDPNNTNGVPFIGGPRIDVFNGGMFRNDPTHTGGGFMETNHLYMRLSYAGRFWETRLQIWGNQFVNWNAGLFADRSSGSPNQNMRTDLSIIGFLDAFIQEWRIRATMGPFTVYMGNEESNFGLVSHMNNHMPSLYSKVNVFGITTPVRTNVRFSYYLNPHQTNGFGDGGGLSFAEINTRAPHGVVHRDPNNLNWIEPLNPYMLFTYTLNKYNFTLGTHLQGPGDPAVATDTGLVKFGNIDVSGFFRVSGNRIADFITFDAVYRIKGSKEGLEDMDPDGIYFAPNVLNPTRSQNGKGSFGHSIGLFVQPRIELFVTGFNLVLGYSALFQTLEGFAENWDGNGAAASDRRAPFFSGIDLRMSYSGVRNFLFSSQNNISFASMNGSDTDEVWGVRPRNSNNANVSPLLKENESDNWFYLYNTLGAQYNISSSVAITLGFANRLGLLTEKRMFEGDQLMAKRSTNWFSGELMASYFYQQWFWELHGGIAFLHQYSTYESNDIRYHDVGSGRFVFAIPVRFVWRIRSSG